MSFKINTAVTGFTFGLSALADGTPVTTGTTTGFVTIDGGTQGSTANATHEGNGQWSVNLTAANMNGAIIGLVFVNTLAINVNFTIKTDTVINSDLNDAPAAPTAVQNRQEMDSNSVDLNQIISDVAGLAGSAMRGTDGANTVTPPTVVQVRQEMDSNSVDLNQIISDVAGLAGAAMRGTDGANTVVPDPAGTAPTAIQVRQEMDSNSVDLNQIVSDVAGLAGAAMRGTDGANTVVPDPAGTGPTKNDIAASFTEIKGANWNSIDHTLEAIGDDTNTNIPALLNDIAITKNQAGVLTIQMVLATDGRTPGLGLTVTAQRSLDGGGYVNAAGTLAEISNGSYAFTYTAADSAGDMIVWKFSAATADDTFVTFLTVA